MKISREDWERVIEKACDIANATDDEADAMYHVQLEGMMVILDELEKRYGPQSRILSTRADYIEDVSTRRALYEQALDLARRANDVDEIEEILDSINRLGHDEHA